MRIAIVGGGISGLVSAYLLSRQHEVTVLEAAPRLGGHTHTISVDLAGEEYRVDTGFIVFNEPNYPGFNRLLGQLGVDWQTTSMSFGVRCDRGELNVETNDFLAEGDVQGTAGDSRQYQAAWVRYNHEQQLLYTDAPVRMQDETGDFRGDGFRYYVKERRFELLGNVTLVQGE